MAAAAQADAHEADGFVRLVATAPLHADPERVVSLLEEGATSWLEDGRELPEAPGMRRYEVDLRLRIGGEGAALTTFRKAAYLDIGPVRRSGRDYAADISWRASTAAPLFPVFAGALVVTPEELRIEGLYAPPGGVVGRVADRMLLHTAANGTARWLLSELDRAARGDAR